jgi:hypothetical protein
MSRNNDKANTGTIENRLSFICPTIQLTISQMGTEGESEFFRKVGCNSCASRLNMF